ncbi:MAG: hypothetical protein AMDU1_APLC00005G0062 [Thermoplasmatales archaeon A-plasma]|jgi:hypothetical protein|nr:MAG: hypothetical protein AMDU1_APLC00005G0062 [Thermoplasmatales archaeon A-plasma]
MISEVVARNHRFEELESRLNTLKEDWSRVVAHPDYEMYPAFYVLEKEVERAIEDCGYSFSKDRSDTRSTLGNEDTALEIFFCIPGTIVIIYYSFERVVFKNGDKDTEMRLGDIKVVSL